MSPARAMKQDTAAAPPDDLARFFEEHSDAIFRTAYRVTGRAADAEDVLQTIFLRLLRREGNCALQPHPKAYLLRAAVNAALDIVRRRNRLQPVSVEDGAAQLLESSPQTSPERQQQDRETQQKLRQALGKLSAKSAAMFVLRYFEGYDNRAIAEILDTSPLVVGVMLHRSRKQLRQELGTL